MNAHRGRLVSGGRLQIPAEVRRELGIADGDQVLMSVSDGELHVRPVEGGIGRAQTILAKYVGPGESLVDELIRERREAATRE